MLSIYLCIYMEHWLSGVTEAIIYTRGHQSLCSQVNQTTVPPSVNCKIKITTHNHPATVTLINRPKHMNSMKLVIPLHSLYESIHTKDESKRGTAFTFIFGVNWLWRLWLQFLRIGVTVGVVILTLLALHLLASYSALVYQLTPCHKLFKGQTRVLLGG